MKRILPLALICLLAGPAATAQVGRPGRKAAPRRGRGRRRRYEIKHNVLIEDALFDRPEGARVEPPEELEPR